VALTANTMRQTSKLQASVTVTNTGNYDGEEVVQLYIQDIYGSVTRPVKELKGFQKIFLKKGESKKVTFNLSVADLKFYNANLKYAAEPGDFNVFVGANSRDVSTAKFTLIN
jgi:beta-glucosidase